MRLQANFVVVFGRGGRDVETRRWVVSYVRSATRNFVAVWCGVFLDTRFFGEECTSRSPVCDTGGIWAVSGICEVRWQLAARGSLFLGCERSPCKYVKRP